MELRPISRSTWNAAAYLGAGGISVAGRFGDYFVLEGHIAFSDTVRIDDSGRLVGLVEGVERLLLDFTAPDSTTYPYLYALGDGVVDTMTVHVERSEHLGWPSPLDEWINTPAVLDP